jgi:hypothetical protein
VCIRTRRAHVLPTSARACTTSSNFQTFRDSSESDCCYSILARPPDTFVYQAFCIPEYIILIVLGLIGPNRAHIPEYILPRLGPRLPYSGRPNRKT